MIGRIKDKADCAASEAGEGADLQEHMLIENAAAERLDRHAEDVPGDAEDEDARQGTDQSWRGRPPAQRLAKDK